MIYEDSDARACTIRCTAMQGGGVRFSSLAGLFTLPAVVGELFGWRGLNLSGTDNG